MIYIDDFLTRTYWDEESYPHGMGVNIPKDYKEMTVEQELNVIKYVHSMRIDFIVFIVGCVLDSENEEIKEAIKWLVDNDIKIAGHGYYHHESEFRSGYNPGAEMTLRAMKKVGVTSPYLWRYPRHETVNVDYVKSVGFELASYDYYLDPEIIGTYSLLPLLKHNHHNAWCHSVYLTRIYHNQPTHNVNK